jgi:hypothetical protein
VTEERELFQLRHTLTEYPASVAAIIEAAARMRRQLMRSPSMTSTLSYPPLPINFPHREKDLTDYAQSYSYPAPGSRMNLIALGMRHVATVTALPVLMALISPSPPDGHISGIFAAAHAAETLQGDDAKAVTLPAPGMSSSLSFSPVPCSVEVGTFGKWYIDGILSGLALRQSHPMAADESSTIDMSNGQIMVQKVDGPIQFFVQAGTYAIPALGLRYSHLSASPDASNLYGYVPQTYLKLAPSDTFSVQIGKLSSLLGPEGTFDFQNLNIERGLLWNQSSSVSRGVQLNETIGPVRFRLSLNDGYYSNHYNWLTGLVTWSFNEANTLRFEAGGNVGKTDISTVATPLLQNNSRIYDLVYTYHAGALTIMPYLQYNRVPEDVSLGIPLSQSSFGSAMLANYAFTPNWALAGRIEYIGSSGHRAQTEPASLLYGPGSSAMSYTLTPTYSYERYFLRGDMSFVAISDLTAAEGFGRNGNAATQIRVLVETGFLF